MRVEIDVGEAGDAGWAGPVAALASPPRTRRIDRFDLGVLALFGAISLWVLGLDLWQVIAHGRVWTGTDGIYVVDQMQYLAWIRDASQHFLTGNLFVLRPAPADYFQPQVTVSGALTALGITPWVSLLLWKPVAVVCAFLAVRAFCRRSLLGTWPRRAALVLGLFFGSFSIVYGSFSLVGDLFLSFLSWGYTFGLLAVALMVLALLAYDRGRSAGRLVWTPAALGAVAALLHPWQGELLILIVLGSELVMWRRTRAGTRPLTLPLTTVIATGIPLLYYMVLGHTDLSWELARQASKHGFSLWAILMAIGPLAILAAFSYRGRSHSFLTVATRAWPIAALAVWVLSASQLSATPLHAFDGITIPLAVMAVKGAQNLRLHRLPRARALAWGAVVLATVPAGVYLMKIAADLAAPQAQNPNFITADERRAMRYLETSRVPGGVLASPYLGSVVPAETGRKTYEGDCLWSQPGCYTRINLINTMFGGSMKPAQARTFVRSTGARFVVSDCAATADMKSILAPMTVSVTRFGCASVYELGPPGPASEPPRGAG